MKYDIEWFINKFIKIPATKWTTRVYRRGQKRCALGWCGLGGKRDLFSSKEARALRGIFRNFNADIPSTNDDEPGGNLGGGRPDPRGRILHALHYFKALQPRLKPIKTRRVKV